MLNICYVINILHKIIGIYRLFLNILCNYEMKIHVIVVFKQRYVYKITKLLVFFYIYAFHVNNKIKYEITFILLLRSKKYFSIFIICKRPNQTAVELLGKVKCIKEQHI